MFFRVHTALLAALTLAFTVMASLAGCGPATRVPSAWAKPGGVARPMEKLVAMAVMKDQSRRRVIEDRMVAEIRNYGREAVASYTLFPEDRVRNSEQVRNQMERAGFDGVLMLRPLGTDTARSYVPGNYATFPVTYRTYWGYYRTAWAPVWEPGYMVENRLVKMETMLYDLRADELVYAGMSETSNPNSLDSLLSSLAKSVREDMRKRGVLQPLNR